MERQLILDEALSLAMLISVAPTFGIYQFSSDAMVKEGF